MGNEQKQQQRINARRPPANQSPPGRYRGNEEPPINFYETLHEPERSEMLDFSGVFPTICLESASGSDDEVAESATRRGIPRTPVVIDPRQLRPRRHYLPPRVRSRSWTRSHNQRLYRRFRPAQGGWSEELLERLPRRPLRHLQQLWRQEGQEWRGQLQQVLQWRPSSLQWRSTGWKLLPLWMVANLVLLLLVLLAMASQALPKTLAHAAVSSCRWHTVASGETLYSISASYRLAAGSVAEANHLKSYGAIHSGQQLCIPVDAPTLPPVPADALVAPNTIAAGPAVTGATAFLQFALPYAESAHQQTGWPVSMILAQWALEHGWTVPGFTGYNWGNVAALAGVPHVASGGAPGAPALFSYAPTPQDGVNYYVAVAGLPYYSAVAPAARSGGPDAAARALGESPWDAAHYTDVGSPGSSLITIMKDFDLYRFDG